MKELKFCAWNGSELITELDFEIKISKNLKDGNLYKTVNKETESKPILLEYTGLKDIDGQEIFESDVLITNDGEKWIMCFTKGRFMPLRFYGEGKKIKAIESTFTYENVEKFGFKKIGNFYENPDFFSEDEKVKILKDYIS